MYAYLDLRLDRVRRARHMDRVETSIETPWEQMAEWNLYAYLSIPLGREDFDQPHGGSIWEPELRQIGERLINEGIRPCAEIWSLDEG